MALIKYNIYYSISPKGPWILANETPVEDLPSGNSFTISNLQQGTVYYVTVVAGIEKLGIWYPIAGQSIGTIPENSIGVSNTHIMAIKTFPESLNVAGETKLAITFTVNLIPV